MFTELRDIPNKSKVKVYFNEEAKFKDNVDGLYCWAIKIGMSNNKVLVHYIDDEITDYNDAYFLDAEKVDFNNEYKIKRRPVIRVI